MALPFYNQADQDIYAGGEHFIPQENYRLNYTPPAIMGQNTNAGIATTQVAAPFKRPVIWPPEGGGGGGSDEIIGYNPNQNLGPTNITDYESEAYGIGPTWQGTLARLQNLPTPTSLLRRGWKGIQNWRDRRTARQEQEKIAADITATQLDTQSAAGQTTDGGDGASRDQGGGYSTRGGFTQATQASPDTGRGHHSWAQGGRIGFYRGLSPEDYPENESENMFDFMQDQGIPYGEMASDDSNTRLLEQLYEEFIDQGFSPEDAEKMALEKFELMAQGSEQGQGLASLV